MPRFESDGSKLGLQVDSAIPTGELHGNLDVSLAGVYPLSGQVTVSQIDLDPLIVSALHLSGLTGHSQIVGRFGISGALLQPDTISVDANLSQVSLDYQYIKLQNQGPVQLLSMAITRCRCVRQICVASIRISALAGSHDLPGTAPGSARGGGC